MMMTSTSAAPAMIVSRTVSWSSWRVSGVFSCLTPLSIPEIWPTSVSIPVAVTTISPAPARDGRVHVGHVHAVAEGDVVAGHRVDRLQHGHALSGQGRLLDLEGRGDEQAPVGGDLVAGLEGDDVTRHELLRRDVDPRTAAAGVRLDHEHLLERGDALGRLPLLVQAQDRVQHRDAEDREPRAELLKGDHADDRRPDEDELHQVAVLAQERVPARLLRLLGQLVRPVLRAALLDLAGVEPGLRGRLSSWAQHVLRREAVPDSLVVVRARRLARRRSSRLSPCPGERAVCTNVVAAMMVRHRGRMRSSRSGRARFPARSTRRTSICASQAHDRFITTPPRRRGRSLRARSSKASSGQTQRRYAP